MSALFFVFGRTRISWSPVAPGDYSPGAHTDPDVQISRIWLVVSCLRGAKKQALGYARFREPLSPLKEPEYVPLQCTGAASPQQPTFPDLPCSLQALLKAEEVAGVATVPAVTSQLLRQRMVLLRDREVPILPAPFRQRCERSLESASGRLAFDQATQPRGFVKLSCESLRRITVGETADAREHRVSARVDRAWQVLPLVLG